MSCTNDSNASDIPTRHSFLHNVHNDTGNITEFKDEPLSNESSSFMTTCGHQISTSLNSLMGALSFSRPPLLYSQIRSDEQDTVLSEYNLRQVHATRRSLWYWRCFAALLASALLLISVGFWTGGLQVSPLPPGSDITSSSATLKDMPLSCGNTTTAAVRRDCVYNPLSNRWLPKRCVAALSEHVEPMLREIDPLPFRFYQDSTGSREIHGHDWAGIELGSIVWTTERHHITHCVNLLVQGAARLAFGGLLEEHARDWTHVKHCAETILTVGKGLPGWNDINSFVHVSAGECV